MPSEWPDMTEPLRVWSGSDTDGVEVKAGGLPMSVMGLHIHLLVSDHSEMASY